MHAVSSCLELILHYQSYTETSFLQDCSIDTKFSKDALSILEEMLKKIVCV